MTKFKVRDGTTRVIEFEGERLAEVSSRRSGSPRWTELRLYRTQSGVFVLEKVGASVVVHAPGCPEILPGATLPRFQAEYPGEDPANDSWWWCESCGARAAQDMTALLVEQPRFWAIISETPDEIVDSLYRRKGGARTMPRMSLVLLEDAAKSSPEILDSYRSEVLI
jgi:hypothetical protein